MQKVVINKLNPNLNLQKFIVDTGDEDVSVMATNKDSAKRIALSLLTNEGIDINGVIYNYIGIIVLDNGDTEEFKINAQTEEEARQYLEQYIRMQQMKNVENWINASMKDISHTVGFLDADYFSKAFKKKYRISPTDVKKECRK